jgi:hypothetical protein
LAADYLEWFPAIRGVFEALQLRLLRLLSHHRQNSTEYLHTELVVCILGSEALNLRNNTLTYINQTVISTSP